MSGRVHLHGLWPGLFAREIACVLVALMFGVGGVRAGADGASGSGVTVRLFDELEPLFPDTPGETGVGELEVHTARGVPVSVHALVTGIEAGWTVDAAATGGPGAMSVARLRDVPVEENTGLESRTEQYDGRENPHVIRRAPFRIFEVVEPVSGPIVSGGSVEALRLTWIIDANAEAGEYLVSVEVGIQPPDGEAIRRELRVRLRVHEAVVPPIGPDSIGYTNWMSLGNAATYHGLERWSEAHWGMIAEYAELMAHARQNMFLIQWGEVFGVVETDRPGFGGRRLELDQERLVRLVGLFSDAGLYRIEMGHPLGRPGGDWGSPALVLHQTREDVAEAVGRAQLDDALAQLRGAIDENGWRDRWLQHVADEPTGTNAAAYHGAVAQIRDGLGGVPIFEATMTRELAGAIDVWCPQVQKWQGAREFFDERQEAGDRVWVYTCLVPGGPWVNRLLDQERLRQVWIGWGVAEAGLDGYLHWGLNHWKADPFAQSVVDHPAVPNSKNKLPAGDTHVVYPGEDGPLSGLRLEAHRIGLEDGELIRRLKGQDPARAERIVRLVVRGFDDYAVDVADYRAAKLLLLEAVGIDERR